MLAFFCRVGRLLARLFAGVWMAEMMEQQLIPNRSVGDECRPLYNIDELLNFREHCCCYSGKETRLLPSLPGPLPNRPRVLLCHDFKGGYLVDRHHGQRETKSDYCASLDYRFDRWRQIDVFVYFSHHFVTIPPCSWIADAHAAGVNILGTVIVEHNVDLVDQMLAPDNIEAVACALAELCHEADFDGWLFNIEIDVSADQVSGLITLLESVRNLLQKRRPGGLVLWYDAVTTSGSVSYKNELTTENKVFFDACDGIFLNYGWTEDHVKRSEELAGERRHDVYVGVDVFGRSTEYDAGFNTPKVVTDLLSSSSCSVAIFAPGWVLECNDVSDFEKNQARFWEQMPRLK